MIKNNNNNNKNTITTATIVIEDLSRNSFRLVMVNTTNNIYAEAP